MTDSYEPLELTGRVNVDKCLSTCTGSLQFIPLTRMILRLGTRQNIVGGIIGGIFGGIIGGIVSGNHWWHWASLAASLAGPIQMSSMEMSRSAGSSPGLSITSLIVCEDRILHLLADRANQLVAETMEELCKTTLNQVNGLDELFEHETRMG
ncbi:hypothetical protein DFH29DRAFT_876686 [Suillus ampliporus]|nr:hypothetical protein DFH29DRAFT_876686 [Suillus ampliporus]